MRYSIIIVAYNAFDLLERCLNSVHYSTDGNSEVVLVDNSPQDMDPLMMLRLPFTQYYRDGINHGFAEGCNIGARMAKGETLIFLNPDTEVFGNWADELAKYLNQDGVGAVGPISNFVAGLQRVDFHMQMMDTPEETAETAAHALRGRGVDSKLLIGFCLCIRKATYEQLGGMDPLLFLGNDDLDLSWRLQLAGLGMVIASDVFVYHAGHKSFETRPKPEVEKLLQESEDALKAKLAGYYYDRKVPSAVDLWGVDFFHTSPSRPMTLSVCMIVRDEADKIWLPIEDMAEFADECIVVDTGSTDATVQKLLSKSPAGLYPFSREENGPGGKRLYHFPWDDDFAAARNYATSKCTGDYILWLDADDRVTPESAALIRAMLQNPGPKTLNKHVYFSLQVENLTAEGKPKQRFTQPRIFPNGRGVTWTGRIHESFFPSAQRANLQEVPISITIQHTGYSDPVVMAKKCERNLRILSGDEDSPSKFYNIGNTLGMVRQFQEALEAYDTVLTREWAEPLQPAFRDQVRHMATLQLLNMGKMEEMAPYLGTSRHPDAPYMAARLQEHRGLRRQAIDLLRGYLEDTAKVFYWPWGSDFPALRPAAYALMIDLMEKERQASLEGFAKEYPEHCVFEDA
jgi:GT2 family glycosyltransferase